MDVVKLAIWFRINADYGVFEFNDIPLEKEIKDKKIDLEDMEIMP